MKTISLPEGSLLVTLTRSELITLSNALNYVTNGISLGKEYSTLIGVEPKDGRRLLKDVQAALKAQ
jgi:hypothetical protein